jgi:hypothetical protein
MNYFILDHELPIGLFFLTSIFAGISMCMPFSTGRAYTGPTSR